MGNIVSMENNESVVDEDKGANVTDLRRFFDVKPYLGPDSDIVALMVMEQQMDVQNAIVRTASEIRNGDELAEACEPLVRAILSRDEVKLTAPIRGTSAFADHYAETAPKDRKGRSLSQLNLKTRLLQYSCSPLIYSASFDALPPAARVEVRRQMNEILRGKESDSTSERRDLAARIALSEILIETKPGLLPVR